MKRRSSDAAVARSLVNTKRARAGLELFFPPPPATEFAFIHLMSRSSALDNVAGLRCATVAVHTSNEVGALRVPQFVPSSRQPLQDVCVAAFAVTQSGLWCAAGAKKGTFDSILLLTSDVAEEEENAMLRWSLPTEFEVWRGHRSCGFSQLAVFDAEEVLPRFAVFIDAGTRLMAMPLTVGEAAVPVEVWRTDATLVGLALAQADGAVFAHFATVDGAIGIVRFTGSDGSIEFNVKCIPSYQNLPLTSLRQGALDQVWALCAQDNGLHLCVFNAVGDLATEVRLEPDLSTASFLAGADAGMPMLCNILAQDHTSDLVFSPPFLIRHDADAHAEFLEVSID